MTVRHIDRTATAEIQGRGIAEVTKKVLISPADGWDGWVMRLFELRVGGHTPRHVHGWPHINYIVAGRGLLHLDGQDHPVGAGSYAFIPAGAEHQFANDGDAVFSFICIVPAEGDM